MLTGLLLAACSALLVTRQWPRARPGYDFGRVHALLDAGRADDALAELDQLGRRTLDSEQKVEWLNLRVAALGMAGRCDEALEIGEGLETLDDGDGGLRLVVMGNRAIALVHADRLGEAEPLLDETEALAESQREAGHTALADINLSETWWWRAEIARRRGDVAARRRCLERAASFGGVRYAERARRALESCSEPAAALARP